MKLHKKLAEWQTQGLLSADQVSRIEAFELENRKGDYLTRALMIGGLAIALGLAAIVSANWNSIGDLTKIIAHLVLSGGLSLAFYKYFDAQKFPRIREILILLIFASIITFIALMGQIFQTQAPTVVPLTLWLLLGSPLILLFSNARTVIGLWLAALVAQQFHMHIWLADHYKNVSLQLALFALFSFGFFVLSLIKNIRPIVQSIFLLFGGGMIVGIPALAQFLWRVPTSDILREFSLQQIWPAAFIALCLIALAVVLAKYGKTLWPKRDIIALSIPSLCMALLPILMPHPSLSLIAGLMFIAWWLWVGYLGLHLSDRLVDVAITMIAIRVFVFYFEALGSLTTTGFGLIFGGLLFIGLTYGTLKLRPTLKRLSLGGKP